MAVISSVCILHPLVILFKTWSGGPASVIAKRAVIFLRSLLIYFLSLGKKQRRFMRPPCPLQFLLSTF